MRFGDILRDVERFISTICNQSAILGSIKRSVQIKLDQKVMYFKQKSDLLFE